MSNACPTLTFRSACLFLNAFFCWRFFLHSCLWGIWVHIILCFINFCSFVFVLIHYTFHIWHSIAINFNFFIYRFFSITKKRIPLLNPEKLTFCIFFRLSNWCKRFFLFIFIFISRLIFIWSFNVICECIFRILFIVLSCPSLPVNFWALSLFWLGTFSVAYFFDHWFFSTAYFKMHCKSSRQKGPLTMRTGFHLFLLCFLSITLNHFNHTLLPLMIYFDWYLIKFTHVLFLLSGHIHILNLFHWLLIWFRYLLRWLFWNVTHPLSTLLLFFIIVVFEPWNRIWFLVFSLRMLFIILLKPCNLIVLFIFIRIIFIIII